MRSLFFGTLIVLGLAASAALADIGFSGGFVFAPIDFHDQSWAGTSNLHQGRLRYNDSTQRFEISTNGGAFGPISTSTGSGGGIQAVNGTPNEVTAATVAGVVTVSLPSSVITPGSLTVTTTLGLGPTVTGSSTWTGPQVFAGVSNPGTGTGSETFGSGAASGSPNSLAVGRNATITTNANESILIAPEGTTLGSVNTGYCDKGVFIVSGSAINLSLCHESVAVGWLSAPAQFFQVLVGANTSGSSQWSVLLGAGCGDASHTNVIAIGAHVTATSNNEIVIGGTNGNGGEALGVYEDHLIFNGTIPNPPALFSIYGSKSGTPGTPGTSLALVGGLPNSSADSGGNVYVKTVLTGNSTESTVATFDTSGNTTLAGNLSVAGTVQCAGTTGSGSITASLSNFPGVSTGTVTPYTWLKMLAPDGTPVFVAAFK